MPTLTDRKLSLATPEGRLAFSRLNALQAAAECRPGAKLRPTEPELHAILEVVPACRIGNWGGGACHVVSEVLENEFGWRRVGGSVLDPDGRVVCPDGHLWNVLPDGAWLDATADQFGEPRGVRIIPVGHPDHARYRFAFSEDFWPGDPHFAAKHPAFSDPAWPLDEDAHAWALAELGDGWWVTDRVANDEYRWRNIVHTAAGRENSPFFFADLPEGMRLEVGDGPLIQRATRWLGSVVEQHEQMAAIPWGRPGNRFGDPAMARLSVLVDQAAKSLVALDEALRAAGEAGDVVDAQLAGDRVLRRALGMRMRSRPYEHTVAPAPRR